MSCNYPHTKLVKIEFYISPGTRKIKNARVNYDLSTQTDLIS